MRLLIISLLLIPIVCQGQFFSGDEVVISEPSDDDLYIGAGEVSVEAPVYGDVVASGGTVSILDSVQYDLIAAGGILDIEGVVGDDARLSGGFVQIDGDIVDDLVVFGGTLELAAGTIVGGDVVVFGGSVNLNGEIRGALRAFGGEIGVYGNVGGDLSATGGDITIGGDIGGESVIAAETLVLEDGANFQGDILYWTDKGEVLFEPYLDGASATYDESLQFREKTFNFLPTGQYAFWILYALSAFVVITLLTLAFFEPFKKSSAVIMSDLTGSLLRGLAYVLIVPVMSILLIVAVITLPIGFTTLSLYAITMLFGTAISAGVLVHFLNHRMDKEWGRGMLVMMAFVVFVVIKVAGWIPVLGWIVKLLVIMIVFGAIIQVIRQGLRRDKPTMDQPT